MSKLSVHILDVGSGPAKEFVLATRPGFVKVVGEFGAGAELQRLVAGLIAVGRITDFYDANYAARSGAAASAEAARYAAYQRVTYDRNPEIKVWEGPNEPVFGRADDPANVKAFQWYGEFEAERVRLLAGLGLRGVVGNFAYGTPDLALWGHFAPALAAARQYRAWIGVHEYQNPIHYGGGYRLHNGQELELDWGWMFLRCQTVMDQQLRPMGFGDLRFLITECGTIAPWHTLRHDQTGEPLSSAGYAAHLARYDVALRGLSYVDGATLFTSGRDWGGFGVDHTDILARLAAVLPVGSFLAADEPPASSWIGPVRVRPLFRNLRRGAGAHYPAVAAAYGGAAFDCQAVEGEWLQVDGKLWIHQSGVSAIGST